MHHAHSILWNRTVLSCSAVVFAILICFQIARPRVAFAGDSVQGKGGISMASIRNGFSQQFYSPMCLWVVDDQSEMLFIYYVENVTDKRLQLRWSESLPKLFRQARGN
ncbi:MAG: hypothetical protein ACOYMO_07400 [Phycisphaerales bacterium]|jgi:hypothetical protein